MHSLQTACSIAVLLAAGVASVTLAQTRDSAGVRIVESDHPLWEPDQVWQLSSAPVVEIGGDESLYNVGNAVRLRDGRIVVANSGSSEIRVYSATGDFLTAIGGKGSGPGEFRELSRMFVFGDGDSILTFDGVQFRTSIFDSDGRLVRSYQPKPLPNGMPGFVEGAFQDGSLMAATLTPPQLTLRGLVRAPRSLWRYNGDGGVAGELGTFPGNEMFYQQLPTGQVDFRPPFFGQRIYYTTWRDRFFIGVTDVFEIKVYTLDGQLAEVIRKRHDYLPVTETYVDQLIARRLENIDDPNTQRQVRRLMRNMPTEGTVPAFGWPTWADHYGPALQVDNDGNLWVVKYSLPEELRNDRLVFDADGVWLGTVQLPERFAPKHIGSDWILGTWTDSLDVEHIRLYDLMKPTR